MKTTIRISELNMNQEATTIVVEFRPSSNKNFSFQFKKEEDAVIGECEYCQQKNILRAICECKMVKYCDQDCLDKDIIYHKDNCHLQTDTELKIDNEDMKMTSMSYKGVIGLVNLGNTCYMNSSL